MFLVEWIRIRKPAPRDGIPDGSLVTTLEAYSEDTDETLTLTLQVDAKKSDPSMPDWSSIRPSEAAPATVATPDLQPTSNAPKPASPAGGPSNPIRWRRTQCLGCDARIVRARDSYVTIGGTPDASWLAVWPTGPELFGMTGPIPTTDLYLLGHAHRACAEEAQRRVKSRAPLDPEGLPSLLLDEVDGDMTLHLPADGSTCPFCNSTADLTDEHVWAQWVSKELAARGRSLAPRPPSTRPGTVIDVTVPVCRSCNTTWMSTLENDAAEIMRPMLRGYEVELNGAKQRVLATWAAKTAFMIDRVGESVVPRGFAMDLAINRMPSKNSLTFIGAYGGRSAALAVSQPFDPPDRSGQRSGKPNAVVTTFTVHNIAFQVITHFSSGRLSFNDERTGLNVAFHQLHPISVPVLRWPPEKRFGDESFQAWAKSITT